MDYLFVLGRKKILPYMEAMASTNAQTYSRDNYKVKLFKGKNGVEISRSKLKNAKKSTLSYRNEVEIYSLQPETPSNTLLGILVVNCKFQNHSARKWDFLTNFQFRSLP